MLFFYQDFFFIEIQINEFRKKKKVQQKNN